MVETQHQTYMKWLKNKPNTNPEPLSEKEEKRLKDLETYKGVGLTDYLAFLGNRERQMLRHKKIRYTLSRCGACPEGTTYDDKLKKCVEA